MQARPTHAPERHTRRRGYLIFRKWKAGGYDARPSYTAETMRQHVATETLEQMKERHAREHAKSDFLRAKLTRDGSYTSAQIDEVCKQI
jgi:hypothetical protein